MSESADGSRSIVAQFIHHLFNMPGWQKIFLSGAAIVGTAGAAGQTYTKVAGPSSTPTQTVSLPAPPQPKDAPGFIGQHPGQLPPPVVPDQPAPQEQPTLVETHSPWMTTVGFSFVGGFIIGWAFRVFVKTMAIVTFLGVALLMGLSYFHIVNVDLSRAREQYAGSIAWVTDQASKLKDVALAHFPSTGTSMAGLIMGLRKR